MPHELVTTLETLRRRMLRQRWMGALAAIATVLVGGAIVLATLDFTLRISDPGLRWMLSLSWAAVILWAGYRFGLIPLRQRFTTLDMARQVEREYPQFGDRLASALEFVGQAENDPLAGSAEMRRAVVVNTSASVERLPSEAWNRVIDSAPLRRALWTAGVVCGLAVLTAILIPSTAQLAVARLLQPWRDLAWPRMHNLELVEAPSRLATGQAFEATVVDRHGALPEDGQIHYQFREGSQLREESFPLQTVGDALVARRENVQRSFAFRVTGGDDHSMPWREVTVVDPPQLASLEVTARPPDYTGLPTEKMERHLRVLAGSVLSASGNANEPLREAAVEILEGPTVSAEVDGKRIAVPSWPTDETLQTPLVTTYRLRIVNREGIAGTSDAWTFRVDPDPPPEVAWVEPSSDQFVLADAVVPIRVSASDNLAIQNAAILYRLGTSEEEEPQGEVRGRRPEAGGLDTSEEEEPQRVEIHAGAATPPEQPAYAAEEIRDRRELQYTWDLSPLKLAPGTEVSMLVEATDYQPAAGRTALPRRIRILTLEEFESRLANRQTRIVRELEQALAQQRGAQQRTRELELGTTAKPAPTRGDIDQLATTGLDQRQVGRRLIDPAEGVLRELESLRNDLANNRLERPELSQQLQRIESELNRLGHSALPQAEAELTFARKTAEALARTTDAPSKEALANSLAEAGQAQTEIADTLEQLISELQQWSDFQRFAREVARLQQEQEELRHATQSAAVQVATATPARAQQLEAERQQLIEQQSELTRRLDKLQQEMEQVVQESDDDSSAAAENIADALDQSREQGTAGKLREATRELQSERLGRAAEVQQQAEQDLQALLDTLRGRTSRNPEALAEQLREAQEQLAELREELADLDRQARQQPAAETQPRQESLAEQIAQAARQMLRMGAQAAGQSTQQAAGSLQGENQPQPDEQQQQAGREQADQQLAQAQKQLEEQIRRSEQQLARRKLDELAKQVADYIERQRTVLTETLRLDDAPEPADSTDLAQSQQDLEDAVRGSAQQFAEQPVFEMALLTTAEDMQQAAQQLQAGDVGRTTQQVEHAALTRLGHIADVLRSEQNQPEPAEEQNAGGEGGQGGQQPPSPIDLAELKMLRLMQAELNQRTRLNEEALARQEVPQPTNAQAAELAMQQERLANLVDEMIRRLSEPQPQRN